MPKIIARRWIGSKAVYDIGVARDHNFLLANGLVAANCFNKSHSTAYAYITYQTAYLKANFPVEYMAALLSSQIGNQDKIQRYIATCQSMGIEVEPPDINRSDMHFTPLKDSRKILFGLSAVRHVGQGAVEHILQVRQAGPFHSLADLCDRVDTGIVNRRAMEALIQAGALDRLHPNRRQMIADLELLWDWANSRAKDRQVGQADLFSLLGDGQTSASLTTAPKAPPVDDYSSQEKLQLEKELLGFYISDHPLKPLSQRAQVLAPICLGQLEHVPENRLVMALVLVTQIKSITTKKGERMAVVTLEDLSGSCEAVAFPSVFAQIGTHLVPEQPLMVWGRVDYRDEQMQLVLEDAQPAHTVQIVEITLTPDQAKDIQVHAQLRETLKPWCGDAAKIPVIATINHPLQPIQVRFGPQFRVQDGAATAHALTQAGFPARCQSLV
ncbi:MAG: OB-fold nucleic acid binding domain-containing protein [Gloeomargarita sp. SKYG116]|nr:OB-fold nucleic acid binding domain-containing protein [Gloeomargarita sp. SKYG116]MDW8400890.1 OB-fold nucleic acid binding domain-containing protein [Gloeomargarita sp. SKYGB_i_bin116]